MEQWKSKEPRINPHTCGQLIFDEDMQGKDMQGYARNQGYAMGKSLQQVVLGKLGQPHVNQ